MKAILATIAALILVGLVGLEQSSAQSKKHSEIIREDATATEATQGSSKAVTKKDVPDRDSSQASPNVGSGGSKRHRDIIEDDRAQK